MAVAAGWSDSWHSGYLYVHESVPLTQAMEDPLEYGDKFKQIFDLCDLDKDGFIDVQHFTELAQDHFGAYGTEVSSSLMWSIDISNKH